MEYIMGRCHSCGGHIMYKELANSIICLKCNLVQAGSPVKVFIEGLGRQPSFEELIVFIMCSQDIEVFRDIISELDTNHLEEVRVFGELLASEGFKLLD